MVNDQALHDRFPVFHVYAFSDSDETVSRSLEAVKTFELSMNLTVAQLQLRLYILRWRNYHMARSAHLMNFMLERSF